MGLKVEARDGCLARGSGQGDVIISMEHSWAVYLTFLEQAENPHDPAVCT